MATHAEDCNFRKVSEDGQRLIDAGEPAPLIDFTRRLLACPSLRNCEFGDYCTILAASLLSEHERHPQVASASSLSYPSDGQAHPSRE